MSGPRQAYPPPPFFYKLCEEEAEGAAETDSEDLTDVVEPPSPVQGEYHSFGEIFETTDGVPKIPVQQLFRDADVDFKVELKKLNRETIFCFLELISVLISNPGGYARNLENLGVILRNVHQLLNLMRPHQALASLEQMLNIDIEELQRGLQDMRNKKENARRILESASASLLDSSKLDMDMDLDTASESESDSGSKGSGGGLGGLGNVENGD
ncbi:hypothetical protein BSKO_00779 [Bryopsis sp. KO-2023]|nr:hypothetical protein BSKO_00779 [Bryopsis sp. KO-2023]